MFQRLADRLGVSVNVIYVGMAALVVGVAIWLIRRGPKAPTAATGASAQAGATTDTTGIIPTGNGTLGGGISNGPWASGADVISANPLPWSPEGGADGGTGLGTGFVPPPTPYPGGGFSGGSGGSGRAAPLIHTGGAGSSGKTY